MLLFEAVVYTKCNVQDQYSGNNTYKQRYVLIPPEQALNSSTPIFLFVASEVALEYASLAVGVHPCCLYLRAHSELQVCVFTLYLIGVLALALDTIQMLPQALVPCKSGQSIATMQLRQSTHPP